MASATAGRVTNALAQLTMLLNQLDSFLGWMWDQRMGLMANAPLYALLLLGWLILWRRQRWTAVVLGSVLLLEYVSLGLVRFQVRWGIPPRYLVPVLPLAGGLLAAFWAERKGRLLTGVGVLLLAVSLWSAAQVIARPLLAYHDDYTDSKIVRLYSDYGHFDI